MSSSSWDGWSTLAGACFGPVEDGSVAMRHCLCTCWRVNSWFSGGCPASAGTYWPLALTLPSCCALIFTTAVFREPNAGGAAVTVGGRATTVTAGPVPGCQDRLAALVRYCRAIS